MRFNPIQRIYEDQPIWRAVSGNFTFIITEDEPNKFSASAKVIGTTPFDGSRHDLGTGYCAFDSFVDAEKACEEFYYQNRRPQ